MINKQQDVSDYISCFKSLYYNLYSNSNTSRAERIVSDITKILLCKLISEQEHISNINKLTGEQLLRLLKEKYPQSCEQFDDFSLDNSSIETALFYLNKISLLEAPSYIIGEAFQSIIGPRIRGDKGQFFTPKELVECIVQIVGVQNKNVVIDPACGTGGFLNAVYTLAKGERDIDESSLHLVGIDKDKDMSDMALATTEIISKGNSSIFNKNSLEIPSSTNALNYLLGSADIVLTNPPFGAKIGIVDDKILSLYEFGHSWTYSEKDHSWYKLNSLVKNQAPQVLFLELCVRLLKPSGILGIVLPEGVFGNKSLGYIWDYLKRHGKILAMIDCPRNTFQPSTDTKTNVLIYKKGEAFLDEIYVAVAKNCGHDKRGRKTNSTNEPWKNDFDIIAKAYSGIPDEKIWKKVKLIGNYFVPRYLAGKEMRDATKKYITIGDMIKRGYLIRKSGKEVGSEAYGTGSIPFVRTSDIINFEISCDPTNAVSEAIYQQFAPQQNLREGDILFIADGRYRIGKTAIITKYNVKSLIQSHIEIFSLTDSAPFTPYEFLYCLNSDEVQEQIRNLVFIQSTLGTLGNRINEIAIPFPERTTEWLENIKSFQFNIDTRAKCLFLLKQTEGAFEL